MLHRLKVLFSPSEICFVWSEWGKSGREHRRHFYKYKCHRPEISSTSEIQIYWKMGNHKGQSDCHSHGGRTPMHAAASVTLSKPVLQFGCVPWHEHHPSTRPAPCQNEVWQHPLSKATAPFLPLTKRETFLFCSVDKCAEERQLSDDVQSPTKQCLWKDTGGLWMGSTAGPKFFSDKAFWAMAVHGSRLCTLPNLDISLFFFLK